MLELLDSLHETKELCKSYGELVGTAEARLLIAASAFAAEGSAKTRRNDTVVKFPIGRVVRRDDMRAKRKNGALSIPKWAIWGNVYLPLVIARGERYSCSEPMGFAAACSL